MHGSVANRGLRFIPEKGSYLVRGLGLCLRFEAGVIWDLNLAVADTAGDQRVSAGVSLGLSRDEGVAIPERVDLLVRRL